MDTEYYGYDESYIFNNPSINNNQNAFSKRLEKLKEIGRLNQLKIKPKILKLKFPNIKNESGK